MSRREAAFFLESIALVRTGHHTVSASTSNPGSSSTNAAVCAGRKERIGSRTRTGARTFAEWRVVYPAAAIVTARAPGAGWDGPVGVGARAGALRGKRSHKKLQLVTNLRSRALHRMNGKLSLPRLSFRDYFTAVLHEHHPKYAALALQAATLAHDGQPYHAPPRSFIDKGKARAIDAIDSIVDSVLYAKSALSSALAEAGPAAPITLAAVAPVASSSSSPVPSTSSSSIMEQMRFEVDLRPLHCVKRRPILPSAALTASASGRGYSKAPSSSAAWKRRRPHRRREAAEPVEHHAATRRDAILSKGRPWQRYKAIAQQSIPSNQLDPSLLQAAPELLDLVREGHVTEALARLSQIYNIFDAEGHLDILKQAGLAPVHLDAVRRQPETADRLLFLRQILTSTFFYLHNAFTRTTGLRWTQAREERLKAQADIEAALLWLFKRPALVALVSFRNQRLSMLTRLCIMSLASPKESADRIAGSLTEQRRHDGLAAMYQTFILALTQGHAATVAFELLKVATESEVPVRELVARKLARILSVEQQFDLADHTFDMLAQQIKRKRQTVDGRDVVAQDLNHDGGVTGANSHRDEGALLETETLFTRAAHRARSGRELLLQHDIWALENRPEAQAWLDRARVHLFAEAAAANGDVEECDKVLGERFALDWRRGSGSDSNSGKARPTHVVYSRRIQARLRLGALGRAETLLGEMLSRGQKPSTRAFENFLFECRRTEDVMLALRILQVHQAFEHPLTEKVLVKLMHIYARRHDSEGAQRVLRLMLDVDLSPPPSAYTALVLAYVEAGEWSKAFLQFNKMLRSRDPNLRPSRRAYELILKALVLSGSSTSEVMRFVKTMERQGFGIDAKTLSLMLTNACDAGHMELATQMLESVDSTLPDGADAFHFSIIIHGFLQNGQNLRAKEYFDTLLKRGLQPSHVTYATFVASHARVGTDEQLQKAMKIASWALSELSDSISGDRFTYANISAMLYMPILRAEVDRGDSVAAEEVFGEMGETTGMTAIRCLTTLLDLQRRDGRIQAAMETWYQLINLACADEYTTLLQVLEDRVQSVLKNDGTPRSAETRLRNSSLLCLPLSIIMDALSAAGLHDEAIQAWMLVRELRGEFDPDNWNVLMNVHAQSGRMREALEIIEHVLNEQSPDWEGLREEATVCKYVPYPEQRVNLLEAALGPLRMEQLKNRRRQQRIFEDARSAWVRLSEPQGASTATRAGGQLAEGLLGSSGDRGQRVGEWQADAGEQDARDERPSREPADAGASADEVVHQARRQRRPDPSRIDGNDDAEDKDDSAEEWLDEPTDWDAADGKDADDDDKAGVYDDDPITVSMARRINIDSCFWFVHQKQLAILDEALEAQGEMRSAEASFDEEGEGYGRGGDVGSLSGFAGGSSDSARFISQMEMQERYPVAARILGQYRRKKQAAVAKGLAIEQRQARPANTVEAR
ncbi:hypothetical protein OC835_002837 [Tilletia horrida]|nr:hypothetical protein OC835_002837 [Tilletia horrida]